MVFTAIAIPAKFMATFNLPKVSMVFSIADLTSPSLVTSVLQKIAEVPNSLTNSLPRIESISKIATLPPPEIIALTVASPKPEAPPVTIA